MNTRRQSGLVTLLAAALLSHQAAAIEEVVVYGKDTSIRQESIAATVFAAMNEYITDLNEAQKTKLDAELAKICEQRIQIAAANLPTRG